MATVVCRSLPRNQILHAVRLSRASSLWSRLAQRLFDRQKSTIIESFPRLSLPEAHGYVPTLSPPEVSSIICANEACEKASHRSNEVVFESNQLGSNHPIEDRRAVAKLVQTGGALYGVYDGHGGHQCAQSITERLLDYVAVSLLPPDQLEKYNHAIRTDSPMDLLDVHQFGNDYANEHMADLYRNSLHRYVVESLSFSDEMEEERRHRTKVMLALRSAFVRLDNDMSVEAQPASGVLNIDCLQTSLSGACACVVHVNGQDLYTANLGDTRAVIGRRDEANTWVPVPVTSDHNVDNDDEAHRVRSAHSPAEAPFILKNNRLLGSLMPLRAFGDIRFKWSSKDLQHLGNLLSTSEELVLRNYYTPPYLINEPEVKYHNLTEHDDFIVIASDGLWDMLSNEEVVNLVGEHMEGRQVPDRFLVKEVPKRTLGNINSELMKRKEGLRLKSVDANSATHLIRHALGYEHRKVSEMLTFPPELSRYYRDDITVTVVFFDKRCLADQ